jgi:hypothetical protein
MLLASSCQLLQLLPAAAAVPAVYQQLILQFYQQLQQLLVTGTCHEAEVPVTSTCHHQQLQEPQQ